MRLLLSFPRQVGAICLLMTALGMTLPQAQANTVNLNLTLTILAPSECTLNNNQQQVVHFGDILLTRIDGNNYKRPVPLSLTCTNLAKNDLALTLQGDAASFSSNGALKTSNDKLGVVFYVNNTRQAINQPFAINYTTLPTLEVAPVKDAAASYLDTDGGYFSASATLRVEYP
ncbi:fimbrial protein [Serratia fonticola]|uniref:fimbrial protein n=1 Tax=Serratia fonticola TaxID=47917 RepID=UPI00042129F9|nr:fimbrial protein [Serratia fonticola]CAI0971856.1 putative minor fimbrial subunit StfF [Serratia fonticola]